MAFCTNCGAEIEDGVRFCTNCGAPVEEPADEPLEDSVEEPVEESLEEFAYESMNESADEPFAEAADEAFAEAADEPDPAPFAEPEPEPAAAAEPETPRCPSCGAELEEGVRFCTSCGAPVEDSLHSTDGLDAFGETVFVDADVTRVVPPLNQTQPAAGSSPTTNAGTGSWQNPQTTGASTTLPPTMPPTYPEQPQPQAPAPRNQLGTGGIIGITLGIVAAVLVVGFGLFYFTNPFGLTDGIFANSAAAQAAAAEEAQAAADEAQAQAEKAQAEKEELQKQLDEANKQQDTGNPVIIVPNSGGSAGGSSGGSSGGGTTYYDDQLTITAPAGYPPVRIGNGEAVLGKTAHNYITRADLAGMNDWELACARNEIFARYGYPFQQADQQEFFSHLSWYSPDPSYSDSRLSDMDWANVELIRAVESEHGSPYTK